MSPEMLFNFLISSSFLFQRKGIGKLTLFLRSPTEKISQFALFSLHLPNFYLIFTTAFLSVFKSVYWNLIIDVLSWHIIAGLSSFESERNHKMMRKNQFLLMPHVPNRDGSKQDSSNTSTFSSNETSETSDLSADPPNLVNQNFLMESHNNENHIAMINENDENYFEIFKAPMKFSTENNSEVTAQIGTTAHLPCTIHSVGEGVVSSCSCNLISTDAQNAFISDNEEHFSNQSIQKTWLKVSCFSFHPNS